MKIFRILLFIGLLNITVDIRAGGDQKRPKDLRAQQQNRIFQDLKQLEGRIETHPEQTIKILDSTIKVTIIKGFDPPTAFAYQLMGRSYTQLQQPELALHFLSLCKRVYEEAYDPGAKTKFAPPSSYWKDLAKAHAQLGDYKNSNAAYRNYASQIQDPEILREIDYLMAENYYALEDFDAAIRSLSSALAKKKSMKGTRRKCDAAIHALAASYISQGNTEQGLEYYKLSLPGNDDLEDLDISQEVTSNQEFVSKALRKQEKYEEELKIREESLDFIGRRPGASAPGAGLF